MRLPLAVLILLLAPSSAGAAVTLGYELLPGDCNRYGCHNASDRLLVEGDDAPQSVTLAQEGGAIVVTTDDPAVTFRAHPGVPKSCAELAPGRWRCDSSYGADVTLHGGDDRLDTAVPVIAGGGAGADRLEGSDVHDLLDGGEGHDALAGRGGVDHLRTDSAHPDALDGGGGADTVIFLGDRADRADLAAGTYADGGTLTAVERLAGGAGDDVLSGDDGVNALLGGDGDDVLVGRGDRDELFGDDGRDRLDGGDGEDRLDPGSTPVEETAGLEDEPTGEIARWDLDRDADRLTCGAGHDRVLRPGAEDVVPRGCEIVTVHVHGDALTLSGLHARPRGGRLFVRVRCGGSIALRLTKGRRRIAGMPLADCRRRTLRLRVPRRLPRLLDVRVTDGTLHAPPARFRVRR